MNKSTLLLLLAGALLLVGTVGSALAQNEGSTELNLPAFDVEFRNFFLIQNDRDFDRTDPLYDENGQTVGYFATILRPGMTWNPIEQVLVRYQLQIGENLWSRNNAEERDPGAADVPVFQTREIWADVLLPGQVGVRTGYQYLYDPTHLFLDRHLGALQLYYDLDNLRLVLLGAMMPDSVYEGTTAEPPATELEQNNFEHDSFIYAFQAEMRAGDWAIVPAIYGWNDKTEVGREKNLVNPCVHADGPVGRHVALDADLALQWGLFRNGGIDNKDVDLFGYAAQIGVLAEWTKANLRGNALFFSGDNGDRADLLDTGYTYSGWSKSATLLLSENELQDQYDNLDERVARQHAGMLLADVRAGYLPIESLELFGVVGYGRAIQTDELADDATVGVEGDLGLTWTPYAPYVSFTVLGAGLWPGESGAAVRNEIDLAAKDPIYGGQALMDIKF